MTDPKFKSQSRPKAIVPPSPDDQETQVICPICKKGLIPPALAAKINELLEHAHDGPDANRRKIK